MKIKVVFSVTFDTFFSDVVQRVWLVEALLSAATETLHYKELIYLLCCWIVASLVRCGSSSSLELFSLHSYSSPCSNFSTAFTKVRKPWNPPLMINTSPQNGFTVAMDTYCILRSGKPVWCLQSSWLSTGHLQLLWTLVKMLIFIKHIVQIKYINHGLCSCLFSEEGVASFQNKTI